MGSVSAVDIDPDGKSVWAGDRCGSNSCAGSKVDPIVKLDPTGKVIKSFGAGLILWPHGMDVDKQGNVWVVDSRVGDPDELEKFPTRPTRGTRVTKFSPDGKVLLLLGTPGKAGNPPEAFTEPNDVVIAPDGSIFVGRVAHRAVPGRRTRRRRSAESRSSRQTGSSSRASALTATDRPVPRAALAGLRLAAVACSSPIAATAASRFSIRKASTSTPGISSAASAGIHIDANDTLYAIDSESDDNYNPGWRKGLRVGSARTGEVW